MAESGARSPDHGGNDDPNAFRYNQARLQQGPTSLPGSAQGSPQPKHGGNDDPNAFRYSKAREQQGSTSSPGSIQSSPKPKHGGNDDPNEFRQMQTQLQESPVMAQHQRFGSPTQTEHMSNAQSSLERKPISPEPPLQHNATVSPLAGQSRETQHWNQSLYPPGMPTPPQVTSSPQPQYSPQGLSNGQYSPGQSIHQPWVPGSPQSPPGATYNQSPQGWHTPQGPIQGYSNQTNIPPQDYVNYQPARGPMYEPLQAQMMNTRMDVNHATERGIIQATDPFTAKEKGYANAFDQRSTWRWKWPNTFQYPGVSLGSVSYRHQDIMQRAKDFIAQEYYLSPTDGHLSKLVVQCTQPNTDADSNTTWRRTFIRNQSPLLLQVANWVLHTLPPTDRDVQSEEVFMLALKWLPSCAMIFLLMIMPINASGQVRNEGKYDPLPYKFWGYPLDARNVLEDQAAASFHSKSAGPNSVSPLAGLKVRQIAKKLPNPISARPLEPKYLCFLTGEEGVKTSLVSEWKGKHQQEPTYVFISYTSEQFRNPQEKAFLHDLGEHTARKVGVSAYWVGSSCLGNNEAEVEENVWNISDVVRGSRKLVIALRDPSESQESSLDVRKLLRQWGSRVWTLPEILLSSSSTDIAIYLADGDIERPTMIHKRNFATMWDDAPVSRELIDHYEGNLVLSNLELVTIALRCLHGRGTTTHLPGDMAYALMGLLRRRPTVSKTDSAFQAFARLSLANDNDLLLERLICILPKSLDQPWYDMADQYEASLWDIYPTTQICGIGAKDTVILDGAYAASIRWKAFAHVANITKDGWRRFFLRYAFRSASWLFITGISLVSAGTASHNDALTGIGGFFLAIALCFITMSPYLIRVLYTGKLWATQPWFFGFEGYLDISTIEQKIFGADMHHLKWSTNGSPLSVHESNEYGECIGKDPTSNPDTKAKVEASIHCRMDEERIFTLVDTYTLTVTMFTAVRPPTAVVLCGAEGGMQRALLCSYDGSSQTMYRESVLRMETPVLEKISRVGRLRLGLRRS